MWIFICVAVSHFILQFIAWSMAPGNTARDMSHLLVSKFWPALSFPIFWIFPGGSSNWYFWGLLSLNSAIWGLAFLAIVALVKRS